MPEEKLHRIEELPDLKANWTESYKCLNEPLLEYVGSCQSLPARLRRNR